MLRLKVRYGRAADFLRDHETQLVHHGLFVRVPPPPSLTPFGAVELTVAFGADEVVLQGQAVQMTENVGIAVSFSSRDAAGLDVLIQRAATRPDVADADPEHTLVESASSASAATGARGTGPDAGRVSKADKIQAALRGSKDDRLRIIRDSDRTLHPYVLKNPRVGIDEVAQLAKTPSTSVEVIKTIAERREWFQRPEIASAIVRNPKTPVPVAVRMLDHISKQELRRLAKSDSARMPILQAARKKVLRR